MRRSRHQRSHGKFNVIRLLFGAIAVFGTIYLFNIMNFILTPQQVTKRITKSKVLELARIPGQKEHAYKENIISLIDRSKVMSILKDKPTSIFEKKRIGKVQGFKKAVQVLNDYDMSLGPLYVLFMSNHNDEGKYWCPDCQRAKEPVYQAFQRAHSNSRLLEVLVGNKKEWKDENNDFRQKEIVYIDYIPSLYKWEGKGKSSHLLSESMCTNAELLDYVFSTTLKSSIQDNEIITFNSHAVLWDFLHSYHNEYPLFLFFLSGIMPSNGRLWCPYCDRAHTTVEFYFKTVAPKNAKLIRVIVAKEHSGLEDPKNPFTNDPVFHIEGIPAFFRVYKNESKHVQYKSYLPAFTQVQKLKEFMSIPNEKLIPPKTITPIISKKNESSIFKNRTAIVKGFSQAMKILNNYDIKEGPLFVVFMSGLKDNGEYWCPDCMRAKAPIYNAFQQGPSNIKLLEVNVGSISEWKDENNDFRMDESVYIDYIPALYKWEGNGKSSNLLSEDACADKNLLNHVFHVDSKNSSIQKNSKTLNPILTMTNYTQMIQYVKNYKNEVPLFLFFVSDIRPSNGRLWCPFCDRAEIPVLYYFQHLNISNAIMLKLVVARNYSEWKNPMNEFRRKDYFVVEGIPQLFRVYKNQTNGIQYVSYNTPYTNINALTSFLSEPNSKYVTIPLKNNTMKTNQIASHIKPIEFHGWKAVVHGYDDAVNALHTFNTSQGSLYVLFMSNQNGKGEYWCPDCAKAQKPVNDAFNRAPSDTYLLEVRVGSREEWKNSENQFRLDNMISIDYIPTLFKWDGNGYSSRLLSEDACTQDELLNYVFDVNPNEIEQLHPISPQKDSFKHHFHYMNSYLKMMEYLDSFQNEYPLFVYFISDILPENGRLWCPDCDHTYVHVTYAYKQSQIHPQAHILEIRVAKNFESWKDENNPFRQTTLFTIKEIPSLIRVYKSTKNDILYDAYTSKFQNLAALKDFFQKNDTKYYQTIRNTIQE